MKPNIPGGQDQHLSDFESMLRIRVLEDKVTELRKSLSIVGSVHLCSGQEAVYVGCRSALEGADPTFSTYRGHGWALACGVPPAAIIAELLGRETGACRGRGGSAYFSAPEWHFYGENSVVGAGAPIACGAALSAKLSGSGRVVVTAFGEGAMNQGAVHEALNFAAYLDLPVIFICENNKYAELTPYADTVRNAELFKRAEGYGIPGVRIDGNDVQVVRATVAGFAEHARAGRGPALIECMTQRLVGHYIGDFQSYRPKGELALIQKHEPIARMRSILIGEGVAESEIAAVESRTQAEIGRAAQEALAAPMADAERVLDHLYYTGNTDEQRH